MTDESGYNSWKNYETWAVKLWLDNEEWSYNATRELVAEVVSDHGDDTDEFRSAWICGDLADRLRVELDENMPDLGVSIWADLLNAAFSEVDWYEIAGNLLSEVDA